MAIWRLIARDSVRCAFRRVEPSTERTDAIRIVIIIMTTKNSKSVKPDRVSRELSPEAGCCGETEGAWRMPSARSATASAMFRAMSNHTALYSGLSSRPRHAKLGASPPLNLKRRTIAKRTKSPAITDCTRADGRTIYRHASNTSTMTTATKAKNRRATRGQLA